MKTDIWGPVVRRWYVVLVGLLLTGAMTYSVSSGGSSQYEAGSTVVLLPGEATTGEGGNPFLFLGDLVQARDALIRTMTGDAVRAEIVGDLQGVDYAVQIDPDTSGPIIVLSASAASPGGALSLRDQVLAVLPEQLKSLQDQAGTPPRAQIRSLTLSSDSEVAAGDSQQARSVIVVGLVGLALTLLTAALIDALMLGRVKTKPAAGGNLPATTSSESAASGKGGKTERPPDGPDDAQQQVTITS